MGPTGFDRANSREMDDPAKLKPLGLGFPGRRSEKVTANDSTFALAAA